MRVLLLHCRKFAYTLDHPATPAADEVREKNAAHADALVALVAFEKKDTESTLPEAAKWIATHSAKEKGAKVVLNSFVHLTQDVAPIAKAKSLLTQLAASVQAHKVVVAVAPFGWHKEFDFAVLGHEGAQSFREF